MAASVARDERIGKRKFNDGDVMRMLDDTDMIEQICQAQGYHWRDGKLDPGATVQQFAWQILMGNVSCDAVRHHANGAFTASAFCQARQRLPLEVLAALSQRIATVALHRAGVGNADAEDHRWRGHRVFRIDGTSTSLPDAPEVRAHFGCSGKQKPGCGYPTAHLLLLTGPAGVGVEAICSPLRTGDMTHARQTHRHLQPGDVLLGDRLFSTWAHLCALQSQQLHGIFPAHHSRQIAWGKHADHGHSRRFVRTLGWRDQLVEYKKPAQCPKWMDRRTFDAAPQWILVREVERMVRVGGVRRKLVLVTTLTDPTKYPAKALVRLLGERWLIETQIRSLKTTMGLERLRCGSVDGVRKELLMYLIVYNLVRLLMLVAAQRQGVPVARVSFADAMERLRWGNPELWAALELVPSRPDRIEPRVVKRRRKPFMMMTQPRSELRRQLLQTRREKAAA
jgi:hypothetical protein